MFDNKKPQIISTQALNNSETKTNNNNAVGEVHTMPMDYYLGEKTVIATKAGVAEKVTDFSKTKKTQSHDNKKLMTIIIIVIVVLLLLVISYVLARVFSAPSNLDTQLSPSVQKVNSMTDAEKAKIEEEAKIKAEEERIKAEEEAQRLAEEATNAKEQETYQGFDITKLNDFNLVNSWSLDKDRDGLTDDEELLIGTDENLIDSDGDTYKDGEELNNLYSPINVNEKLEDAKFVETYVNFENEYKLLYPKDWVVGSLGMEDNMRDVMFTSNNTDFVNILMDQKKSTESLMQWYLAKVPDIKREDLRTFNTKQGYPVIESPDGYTVYIVRGNDVFIINYNIGLKEKASYPNLFRMMYDSLVFLTPEEIENIDSTKINSAEVDQVETDVDNTENIEAEL